LTLGVLIMRVAGVDAGMRLKTHAPAHLVVLVHGLRGSSRDLATLVAALRLSDSGILTLSVGVNEGRTTDGVLAGADRVAADVSATVAANPSLRRISFVGNSLGGLYAREAACRLRSSPSALLGGDRIAGLEPEAFVTIASPHLGVRHLFWVPAALHALVPLFAGNSGSDLFLRTEVLVQMTSERHIRALGAFRRRVAYANAAGDLLVPAYTAAIESEGDGHDLRERLMAAELRQVPWRTVYVQFQGLMLPIAHNMICALSRNPIAAALYSRGATVVDDVATTICASSEQRRQREPTTEMLRA
jgi:pimeloyl-ACP methyl ester carboxylesterase